MVLTEETAFNMIGDTGAYFKTRDGNQLYYCH
mgnify:CR=1 FL=1